MKNINKIKGCILGGTIGDAVGYQLKIKNEGKDSQSKKLIISDNTQMSLFTANALIYNYANNKDSKLINDTIYLSYLDWLQTQTGIENNKKVSWIRDIPELNESRNIDNSCISILKSNKKGTYDKPINDKNDSIAITRVASIGLYLSNIEEVGLEAIKASAITHGNPLVFISSYTFAVLIHILSTSYKKIDEALFDTIKLYNKEDIFDKKTKEYFNTLMNKVINLSKQNISDIEAINQIGDGYKAEETFAIALYSCLKYSNNFNDTIICATNHNGNNCATGTISGNIIGTYLGYYRIPSRYTKSLEINNIIIEIIHDLIKDDNTKIDKNWKEKYIDVNVDINELNKNIKNSKYIILTIFGIIFILTFKMAISYFIKYYNSFNIPIIIDDNGINKLINKSYSINLSLLFNILIFTVPILIILYLKLRKTKKQIYIIFIIIPLILFYTFLFTFNINDKLDNHDWNMSIETVERKQRGGRKGRQCYVYLKGYSNRIKVDSEEYKVYINKYDKVYVIQDMKNGNYKVLSPNHYKYVGNKLSYTNINSLSTKTNNGYLLFMGIILIIVSLFFLLLSIYPLFRL